ncbi:MAG: hypothetical protein IPM80_20840 [Proteobacteria bacterium]|nr:hypothetical protein [Pseudomonadota bacterium]
MLPFDADLSPRRAVLWVAALMLGWAAAAGAAPFGATPLERLDHRRISHAAEIDGDLDALVAGSPLARKVALGMSVEQRPVSALLLSTAKAGHAHPRVLLVGSQHGAAEPAGGEAMLSLARQLLGGDLRPLLDDLDVVLIPDANPDGRDSGHRSNAARVNLNTDFIGLTQPESQALVAALARFAPVAVLDVHESAVLKRKTLAREGYLTDFDAQFEAANHPAMPAVLREFGQQRLLPALIRDARAEGLPAQRYIGEITSIHQAVTNGGLSLRNFRNLAGMSGALAILVETKLDSRDDPWPTFRNIEARVARSLTCQRVFLRRVHAERAALGTALASAKAAAQKEAVTLRAVYALDHAHPRVELALRRIEDRKLETLSFVDHRRVKTSDEIPMPATYVISQPSDALRAALERHGIHYERQSQGYELPVVAESFTPPRRAYGRARLVASSDKLITTAPGALLIDLVQARGRLVPVLLDPRSTSSLMRLPQFSSMLEAGKEFGIYRVRKGVVRAAAP